jgi:hypothetical protein
MSRYRRCMNCDSSAHFQHVPSRPTGW